MSEMCIRLRVRKRKRGEGGLGSKSQNRVQGLGSGSAVSNDDGGWWWVVVGLLKGRRVHKRERGKEVGCQKPETEPAWLGFGSAVLNGGGERRWMLVGWCPRSPVFARICLRLRSFVVPGFACTHARLVCPRLSSSAPVPACLCQFVPAPARYYSFSHFPARSRFPRFPRLSLPIPTCPRLFVHTFVCACS
jgi:hypothetical protein